VLAYKTRGERRPYYSVESTPIVQSVSELPRLKLVYDGKEVTGVVISDVFFWNEGRETIEKKDIAESDPLRLRVTAGEILDVTLVSEPTGGNFSIELASAVHRYLGFQFEFLDHREMICLQVKHTAPSAKVLISGMVKGARGGIRRLDISKRLNRLLCFSLIGVTTLAGLLIYLSSDQIDLLLRGSSIMVIFLVVLVGFVILTLSWVGAGSVLEWLFVPQPKAYVPYYLKRRSSTRVVSRPWL
jgi:hypothetical protein